MVIKTLSIFVIFVFALSLSAQHTPMITNYNATEYKAHHQNWSITQSSNRVIYSANTFGLLSFNGNSWNLNKLKSNKLLRSVFAKDDRIYTGAFEEIGFWKEDACGKLQFNDLTPLIDEKLVRNEEFWHITTNKKFVFFQSFSVLLAFNGQKIQKVPVKGSIMFLQFIGNKGYFQSLEHGIYVLDEKLKPELLDNSGFFKNKTISGIHAYNDPNTLFITTHSDGIFLYKNGLITPWRKDLKGYFSASQINKAFVTKDNKIVLGTIRDGVLIFDENNELLYHINTSNGIQNNTVLAIVEDLDRNIWLGLDKGISKIDMSQKTLQFKDISGSIGSVYTISTLDSILYVGTNQGVYYHDMKSGVKTGVQPAFTLVEGSQGQVWQLLALEDQLFCGHNEGSFLIKNKKAIKISSITGGWYNEFIPGTKKQKLLQGNYTGLCVFLKDGKSLKYGHKIEGYNQPVKKFIFEGTHLWVCNQNSGIKRIRLNPEFTKAIEVKSYDKNRGLNQKNNLDLVTFRNRIMVYDGENHYYYDGETDSFLLFKELNNYDKGFIVRPLDGNSWLRIYPNKAIRMLGDQMAEQIPYLFNRDYHNAIELNESQYAFCLDDGYIIQNKIATSNKTVSGEHTIIIRLFGKDNSCLTSKQGKRAEIPFSQNDLTVYFNDLDFRTGKTYQYRLLPGLSNWKTIDNNSLFELNNLRSGKYRLEIRRHDGANGNVEFMILPPWYLSYLAIMFYIVALGASIYSINGYYNKKLMRTKDKMMADQARLIKEHSMEIENQRLLNENLYKNKELANVTMHLIQKNEILQDIREELMQMKSQDQNHASRDIQIILKQINQNLTLEADKKLFDTSFDEVHEDFLKQLKKNFPSLTREDLKLAAFLKMDLSSKEIAPLFNISLRGLENKRYRLRKKLKLGSEVDLTDYFNTVIK
jgi:hypothetical protein